VIRSLVGASLRFKLVVLTIAAGVLVLGIQQARQMPVDATPEFAPPIIEVQTEALGLSAPEVEELVTLNLEELLNGTRGCGRSTPVGARHVVDRALLRARQPTCSGPASWSANG
jgi:Cu/Ag efflux pump CusA